MSPTGRFNASALYERCEKLGVPLRYDDTPVDLIFTANTKLNHDIGSAVDEHYRRQMPERMIAQMRQTFESGGHRGNDPFGYRTRRAWNDRKHAYVVDQPRTLEIVPEEAEVVRYVFRLLATHPTSEVADILNREGIKHRAARAWTKNAVKDLWRRREVYRGKVTSKRGIEVLPGKHEPILTPEEFRDASAGIERRLHRRAVKDPMAKRFYLLGGMVFCSCGTKMHGTTQKNRGKEWLYYVCPVSRKARAVMDEDGNLVACHARAVRAADADAFVLDALRTFRLPDSALERVRAELERRRKAHKPGDIDRQRERLEGTLKRLGERYDWGELPADEYRQKVTDVRRQLAALPDPDDKIVLFDRYRAQVRSFSETLEAASEEKLRELVALLVDRVETADRQVARVVWTPPARPFFLAAAAEAEAGRCGVKRPRTDSNRRRAP